ncbi:uncharacterized protein SCHCODRAFT_02604814 [Schizophyllum commune H4-8]|uniref:uncharacterized protein n=1 Tax=Schizophyllum commune (strain H4-8 / FGSC 9210) TaxID=578458 RepID=UPI002160ECAD|nr:uncharacterized protein SCHCODRAFT_02604814 [Schizophyllum commune H4-8]KAI5899321.1 hypothetical protein SCHCODRAFT_02604814 [Schizophyllum commune H4-8]
MNDFNSLQHAYSASELLEQLAATNGSGLIPTQSGAQPNSAFHLQATLNTTNVLQMQFQQLQMKVTALEMERETIKLLGGKLESAVKALEDATATIDTTLKRIDKQQDKMDRHQERIVNAPVVSSSSDANGLILRDNIPPPDFGSDELDAKALIRLHTKLGWTETLYGSNSTAPDIDPQDRNTSMRYLRNKDGAVITETRVGQIRTLVRQCFGDLGDRGIRVPNYRYVNLTVLRFLQHEVYAQFPEVNYCDNHWKLMRIYQAVYSSWKQNNPDLATVSKSAIIKAERAASVLRTHTPGPTALSYKKPSRAPVVDLYSSPATPSPATPSPATFSSVVPSPNASNVPSRELQRAVLLPAASLRDAPSKRPLDPGPADAEQPSKRVRTDEDDRIQYKVADSLAGIAPLDAIEFEEFAPPPQILSSPPISSLTITTATDSTTPHVEVPTSAAPSTTGPPLANDASRSCTRKQRVWNPGMSTTPFNLYAHESRDKDPDVAHGVVKAAWDAMKSTGGQKSYAERCKVLKTTYGNTLTEYLEARKQPAGSGDAAA